MLQNIDLLIAIWDGEAAAGRGGTAQIVNRAVADGIAVVWLDPASPHTIGLSWRGAGDEPAVKARPADTFHPTDVAGIARVVKAILSSAGAVTGSIPDTRHNRHGRRRRTGPGTRPPPVWARP